MNTLNKYFLTLAMFAAASGCAFADNPANDPLVGYNRVAFVFNNLTNSLYIRPVTKTYDKVVPYPAKQHVHSFVRNILNVPRIADDVLAGEMKQAGQSVLRVLVNSTLGLAGLFDVATPMGISESTNDLGKVLYRWGWKDSSYFVIPLIGPSTVRDGFGVLGNYFMTPSAYFKPKWRNVYYVTTLVDTHRQTEEVQNLIQIAGVNDYDFVRSSFMQHRMYELNGEKEPAMPDDHGGNDMLGEPPA